MNPRIAIAIAILIVIALLAAGGWYTVKWKAWDSPWGGPSDQVLITIQNGWSAHEIGQELYENGVVKDLFFYKIMADFHGFGSKLKAGEYMCLGTQSPNDILQMIYLGRAYQHKITIPEGLRLVEIAEKYDEIGICPKEEFIEYASKGQTYQDVEDGQVRAPGTEGFLFPDTYSLERNTPANKVVEYMIRRFNTVYLELEKTVPENERWWKQKDGGEVLALVTLASLVEKEAKRDEDRATIASVFLNRIKQGERLGSEATVRYALDVWDRPLTKDELQVDDPYNTYVKKGWPPGAICNPGKESLEAAMKPAKTDYLFFMHTGDGVTEFSHTNSEHERMKARVKAAG